MATTFGEELLVEVSVAKAKHKQGHPYTYFDYTTGHTLIVLRDSYSKVISISLNAVWHSVELHKSLLEIEELLAKATFVEIKQLWYDWF